MLRGYLLTHTLQIPQGMATTGERITLTSMVQIEYKVKTLYTYPLRNNKRLKQRQKQ